MDGGTTCNLTTGNLAEVILQSCTAASAAVLLQLCIWCTTGTTGVQPCISGGVVVSGDLLTRDNVGPVTLGYNTGALSIQYYSSSKCIVVWYHITGLTSSNQI